MKKILVALIALVCVGSALAGYYPVCATPGSNNGNHGQGNNGDNGNHGQGNNGHGKGYTVSVVSSPSRSGCSGRDGVWEVKYLNSNDYTVMVGDMYYSKTYRWESDNRTLSENVSVTGVSGRNINYKVLIQKGTKIVTSGLGNQAHYLKLEISHVGDVFFLTTSQIFSKPVVVEQLVGGKWVKFLTFTRIVQGRPTE